MRFFTLVKAVQGLFAIGVCAVFGGCNNFFYYPSQTMVRTPSEVGIQYEPVTIAGDADPKLSGWFLPVHRDVKGEVKGTVLFLHGNAENISTHLGSVYWLPKEGYQVFLFDYAGYGESEGATSAAGIHRDVARMIRTVAADSRVDPRKLFILGGSLGGTMALYSAAQPEFRHTFRAIIADAPFSSDRRIAREKLALLWLTYPLQWPLGFLVSDAYSPDKGMAEIEVPILFIHGTADETVPPHHSERLCQLAGERCARLEALGAVHNEPLFRSEVRVKVLEFLELALQDSSISSPG
jgi:fermentation-respiration switch protein FrsA (DUF1100 family)